MSLFFSIFALVQILFPSRYTDKEGTDWKGTTATFLRETAIRSRKALTLSRYGSVFESADGSWKVGEVGRGRSLTVYVNRSKST